MRRFLAPTLVAVFLLSASLSAVAAGAPTRSSSQAVVKAAYNKSLKATILVNGSGLTLYLLTSDPKGTATCAALDPRCPSTWPALATTGAPKAGPGVKGSLLGTTKGAHGVTQVTYNNGEAFFYIWYAVSPKGNAIHK